MIALDSEALLLSPVDVKPSRDELSSASRFPTERLSQMRHEDHRLRVQEYEMSQLPRDLAG